MEYDILEYASSLECQEMHIFIDNVQDLKAVIAIHNNKLGPALGGCRCVEYASSEAGIIDAIRLAKAMTYKAALSNLPLGGGKMVLLKPAVLSNRQEYFKAVGQFVDSLQGRYITAVDSGTGVEDMDIIATKTRHVTSTTDCGDPSLMAAEGVERGILAAVQFKLGYGSLKGIHVAIQGLGHAGYPLAKRLHQAGARLTVYDINSVVVDKCVAELNANRVHAFEELLSLDCDVFAPCALGGILNDNTIELLKAPIIAGSANNQLAEPRHGLALIKKEILYAPDYVINAGGLIYVAAKYGYIEPALSVKKIAGIFDTLMEIFHRSKAENIPTSEIVDKIAKERLSQK